MRKTLQKPLFVAGARKKGDLFNFSLLLEQNALIHAGNLFNAIKMYYLSPKIHNLFLEIMWINIVLSQTALEN